jgi:hypothetical protein
MEAEILSEMAEAVEVGAGVASHAEQFHGGGHAPSEDQIPMFPHQLKREGGMKGVVGHPGIEFHPEIVHCAALQT